MTVHLTAAEARRLGLDPRGAGVLITGTKTGSAPPRARARPAIAVARCHDCGAELTGETAAATHNVTTGHNRYETITEP